MPKLYLLKAIVKQAETRTFSCSSSHRRSPGAPFWPCMPSRAVTQTTLLAALGAHPARGHAHASRLVTGGPASPAPLTTSAGLHWWPQSSQLLRATASARPHLPRRQATHGHACSVPRRQATHGHTCSVPRRQATTHGPACSPAWLGNMLAPRLVLHDICTLLVKRQPRTM